MKKVFIGSIFVGLLSGCASDAELQYMAAYSESVVKTQAQIVNQPTLTLTCKEGNCNGLHMTFIHPSDRHKLVVPRVRGTNDVLVETAPSIVKGVTWLGGAFAATRIVDDIMSSAGGNNVTSHNTTAVNGDNNNVTATTELTKSEMGNTFDSSDNSTVDSHDSTATPTVVTQPAPLVVQQPNPLVVQQPDPIVVTQPDPTIVNPVVVYPQVITNP